MSIGTTPPESSASPPGRGKSENDWKLRAFLVGFVITLLLVGGGVVLVWNAQRATRQRAAEAGLQKLIKSDFLIVPRINTPITRPDPLDARWNQAPARTIPLRPQNLAMPSIDKVSVPEVTLKAMNDGQRIAICLSWPDATQDQNVDAARFTDAVAIQLPLDPDASFMMGAAKMPVQIIHWKALWQKDIDEHFQDVQDVHPNYWSDLYWFAVRSEPTATQPAQYRLPESFNNPLSRLWLIAYQAQNPLAAFDRKQPVEELIAEGFGTLVTQIRSSSQARGVWRDGRWTVVIVRPLRTEDEEDFQFHPGARGQIGVAVWDGASQNVGGRKQYSDWIPFQVMP